MNDQTTQLIENLANKLGTTSQYLWRILVKQAPINATINVLFILVTVVLTILLYKIHMKLSNNRYEKDNSFSYHHLEETAAIPMGILGLLIFVMTIVSVLSIETIINGYFNPEYWALEHILNSLKQ